MPREDTEFVSGRKGDRCRAWFYVPDGTGAPGPAVVMAHGFGGTRNAGLEPFAERFCAEGYRVLLFDYRHFGASEGEPRQLLSIPRQLEDWQNAVAFVRRLDGVDAARVGLWGSSFSGGHVVVTAARIPDVACAISQGSMLDGRGAFLKAAQNSGFFSFNIFGLRAMFDLLLAPFGASHNIPVFGPPGTVSCLCGEDTETSYSAIAPDDFVNGVAARVGLTIPFYRPVADAHRVQCPLLLQVCDRDTLVATDTADEIGRIMGDRCTVIHYDNQHFDVYVPPLFDESIEVQVGFLQEHLGSP